MSFEITDSTGLRSDELSIEDSVFSAGCGLGVYVKCGSIYVRGLNLYSDADGSAPYARLGVSGSPDHATVAVFRSGTGDAVGGTTQFDDNWTLIWGNWDASDGDMSTGFGNEAPSTAGGPVDWLTWSTNVLKRIAVGLQRSQDGVSDEFGTGNHLLAIPFIVKRPITQGAGSDLEELLTGVHPADVFASDMYDYWGKNSKTSAINGIVLSDVGGAVAINTLDNPTVDEPLGGGSSVKPWYYYAQM
jgi:hypothetical protein